MPRVSMVDGWRSRPRGTEPARPDLHTQGKCGIIRSRGENRRRSVGEPGVSGPSPGVHELRLHLVIIPPGTRCLLHFHAAAESAIYVVSGGRRMSFPLPRGVSRGRGEPGSRGGFLLRHGTPGASLPPPAGFTVGGPGAPPV